jgi:hypothetical protein
MRMDRKFVRRRRVALVIALVALVALTYGTRDLCWTGFGYGSCSVMIDGVISHGR